MKYDVRILSQGDGSADSMMTTIAPSMLLCEGQVMLVIIFKQL